MPELERNEFGYIKRKRRLGDRKAGRRLRTQDPLNGFMPFIMRTRQDAVVYFEDSLDLDAAEAYIREKRNAGLRGFGMLHLFIAAYCRVISQRPALNRFVAGQRVYARNCIEVVMTVKTRMASDAPESTIKVRLSPLATPEDVYHAMNKEIEVVKNAQETGTDKAAKFLVSLPRFLLRFAVSVLRALDYHDLLPMSLVGVSPFHGSLVVTDLGSLGILPVYHHLYNFGDAPAFLAFGAKRREIALDKSGQPYERHMMDYRVTLDERICDGFYSATSLKYLKVYMKDPKKLDTPPESVVEDID